MRPPLVYHPAYAPRLPRGHRFPMPKFERLLALLIRKGLADPCCRYRPVPAPRGWLELAHTQDYVTAVLEQRLDPAAERRLGLPMNEEVALRARAAVAGTVLASRLALEHGMACNLAGGSHHAFADAGSGFCVFNDVAVASRVLLSEGQVRRVLVIDLDVHQGDGTASIMRGDPSVFTFSMHCRTNFPARKERSHLDLALDPGCGDDDYLVVLDRLLRPLIAGLRPDIVFYNAGVDPHERDRLGRLALTDAGLRAREETVLRTVRGAGIPLVCVVGGGYGEDIEEVVARHAVLHEVARDLG
ncbi:MAG: histone deacetylase [Geminicoccaceae bacterium]